MNRSLMMIFMMGVIAMVLLTAFGSFFVGKLGGAEGVAVLKKDLREIFGAQMADPEALSVTVRRVDEVTGLVLEYSPDVELARRDSALEFHMRRVADFIFGEKSWRRQTGFISLKLTLPDGKTLERQFTRDPPPS